MLFMLIAEVEAMIYQCSWEFVFSFSSFPAIQKPLTVCCLTTSFVKVSMIDY